MSLQVFYNALPDTIKDRVTQNEIEDYIINDAELPFILQQLLESRVVGHTFVFAFTRMHDKAKKHGCKTLEELFNLD